MNGRLLREPWEVAKADGRPREPSPLSGAGIAGSAPSSPLPAPRGSRPRPGRTARPRVRARSPSPHAERAGLVGRTFALGDAGRRGRFARARPVRGDEPARLRRRPRPHRRRSDVEAFGPSALRRTLRPPRGEPRRGRGRRRSGPRPRRRQIRVRTRLARVLLCALAANPDLATRALRPSSRAFPSATTRRASGPGRAGRRAIRSSTPGCANSGGPASCTTACGWSRPPSSSSTS